MEEDLVSGKRKLGQLRQKYTELMCFITSEVNTMQLGELFIAAVA